MERMVRVGRAHIGTVVEMIFQAGREVNAQMLRETVFRTGGGADRPKEAARVGSADLLLLQVIANE